MCLAASLLGQAGCDLFRCSAADAARAGFDDAFLYAEFQKDQHSRSLPATQMLAGEAWSSFEAWIVSPIKITY